MAGLWSDTSNRFDISVLDRWTVYGNILIGRIYNTQGRCPEGMSVRTDALRFVDPVNFEAETLTEKFKLGEPGTLEEYKLNELLA